MCGGLAAKCLDARLAQSAGEDQGAKDTISRPWLRGRLRLPFGYCPRPQSDQPVTTRPLSRLQVRTDGAQIIVESLGVFVAMPPNFLNDRILHPSSPRSSSGEHISGHAYPLFSTICLTIILVNGLFMCLKFQVTTTCMPLAAATAM